MPKGVKASPKEVEKVAKVTYTVAAPFQDRFDSSIKYEPGTDVSHFEASRLESLKKRGLVK